MKTKKEIIALRLKEKIEYLSGKRVTLVESVNPETDNRPRPSRMARPDISGLTKSATAYWHHLYIQDEAEDILQDKYGAERGTKYFNGLIEAWSGGAFYQAVTQVVMEKAKMYNELGERHPSDYWSESYFDVWKRWMDSKGRKYKVSSPEEPKEEPKKPEVAPSVSAIKDPGVFDEPTIPAVSPKTIKRGPSNSYDDKDEQRILDIIDKADDNKIKARQLAQTMANKITDAEKAMRRYRAAEDHNYHDLALIFYKRAVQLGAK
jgi:hypothetical protein